jgi:hypothetical protein
MALTEKDIDEAIDGYRRIIASLQRRLEEFESGRTTIRTRHGSEVQFTDITPLEIERIKRDILSYERARSILCEKTGRRP